ncbi:MAG: hypothetical protein AUK08_00035 [Candidatus Pacebacteria bacterium CG2_30_36_39]|nr:MAG: hypothetical protein AUK08_00035 [Candidatus Pacebacteria bacterium CG2_30_36_39]
MLGLIGLLAGAELITRASLGLSHRFRLSEGFIGLVVLSLGTSLPEIVVTIAGALEKRAGIDTSGIIIGNIIGSSMGNMALILGITGLLGGTIAVYKREIWIQGISLVSSTLAFLVFAQDGRITRQEGLILMAGYVLYFIFAQKLNKSVSATKAKKRKGLGKLLFQLMFGLIIIAQSSEWVITSGIGLAIQLGINQVVIGAILVGIGTSLPELVVSINAFVKGAKELSVGNLLGSNVVNVLLALGGGAVISEWEIDRRVATFDLPFLLFSMVVVILFMLSRKKFERKESFLMVCLFVVYVSLKLMGW